MSNPSQKSSRTTDFILVLLIVFLSFFLWNTVLVFPIKLFVVFLHEASHAITILITGGTISEISLGFDLGGKITAESGNDILIASSGYLGSLFFGLLIYLVAEMQKPRRYVYLSLALLFLIIIFISTPTLEFILIGLFTIGLLVVFGFFVRIRLVKIIVKAISLVSAIYVLIDVKEETAVINSKKGQRTDTANEGTYQSDARYGFDTIPDAKQHNPGAIVDYSDPTNI